MKNKLITTILAAAAIIISAPAAEAQRHHRHHQHHSHYQHQQHNNYIFISGYQRCGTPIYSERYIKYYDCRSYPVYGHRVIRHRPHHVRPAPRGYHVPSCPPPRRSRGYISVRF